jgi:hypothetical protein
MHKTLMSDKTYSNFKSLTTEVGSPISVWIHEVVGDRIVFSDVEPGKREKTIKLREEMEEKEKQRLEAEFNMKNNIKTVSDEKLAELAAHFNV